MGVVLLGDYVQRQDVCCNKKLLSPQRKSSTGVCVCGRVCYCCTCITMILPCSQMSNLSQGSQRSKVKRRRRRRSLGSTSTIEGQRSTTQLSTLSSQADIRLATSPEEESHDLHTHIPHTSTPHAPTLHTPHTESGDRMARVTEERETQSSELADQILLYI